MVPKTPGLSVPINRQLNNCQRRAMRHHVEVPSLATLELVRHVPQPIRTIEHLSSITSLGLFLTSVDSHGHRRPAVRQPGEMVRGWEVLDPLFFEKSITGSWK